MSESTRVGWQPRRTGRRGRPALWLIHALGDSSRAFEPLFETILSTEFELLAPDWPVAGAERVQDFDDLAHWLAACVESHTPDVPVGFVGHSLGAPLAVRAIRRLDGIVGLFSIEGNLTTADAYFSGRAARFDVPEDFHADLLARILELAGRAGTGRRDALLRYHASLSRAVPEALWRLGRAAEVASRGDALGEEYRSLPVATVHYWSPENTSRETQAYIRRHRLNHIVFTGGHWPMVEHPEATALQIRAFFDPLFGAKSGMDTCPRPDPHS